MILGKHDGVLKELIWRYKYRFVKDLAIPLAALLTERFGDFIKNKNLIITAVPITKRRVRWRGFNQSELIARELAKNLNMRYQETLFRFGKEKSQVGLGKRERIKNLKDKIAAKDNISRKKILLVDDVYTTGATLEECAAVLRQNGSREIWGLVLSRD